VTFCVKPPEEDLYVSRMLSTGRGWEPELVSKVMEAMTLHPEAVFLDLGSNIGAYTLPVASMRRRVVAVDMMRDNLAYIKTSLSQAGLDSYVEMVNNAVSDRHETLMAVPGKDHLNPGSKMAITLDLANNMETIHKDTVKAVTVVDIMEMVKAPAYIIKTDIQKYDCKAIAIDELISAGRHIPYLFMEWDNSVAQCHSLATRLRAWGYKGFADMEKIVYEVDEFWLGTDCTESFNIIWIHENEINPWKESKENCNCVSNSNSSVPSLRCGDIVYEFMF